MKNFFGEYDYYLYSAVAILSLIAFFVRHNNIWLVLFFGRLNFGFTTRTRKKERKNNENH